MKKLIALITCALLTSFSAVADMEVITPDGKRALLKDDGTWQYVDALSQAEEKPRYAYLTVENKKPHGNNCTYGLRLQNDLTTEIKDIVFFFSAYNHEGVKYETATRGFQRIKPTNDQYKEIIFTGISCDDIQYVRVHGGDRCEIGDLNKFSAEKSACLKLIYVENSSIVNIFKRYHEEEQSTEEENSETSDNYEDEYIDDSMDQGFDDALTDSLL